MLESLAISKRKTLNAFRRIARQVSPVSFVTYPPLVKSVVA